MTSTNDVLKIRAKETADENVMLRAGYQSAGRGRMGRVWIMPPGAQLAVSFLLRPDLSADRLPALTLVMGLAAAEALAASTGAEIRIKWPNDLITGGRKLAGILTELVPCGIDGVPDGVVTGIGVNVEKGAYPAEIRDLAVSLAESTRRTFDPAYLADAIAARFAERYRLFLTEGFAPMRDAYNALLAGKETYVTITEADGAARAALLIGADDKGRLLVRTEDGRVEALCGGEISLGGIYETRDR